MSRRRITKLDVSEVSAVDWPAQEPATAAVIKRHSLAQYEKREFSSEQRREMAEEGTAMPSGGFPISNVSDLRNAIQAFGRAGDKAAAAKWIARRARELGATDLLPKEGELANLIGKSYNDEKGNGDAAEPDDPKKEPIMSDEDKKKMERETAAMKSMVSTLESDLKKARAQSELNDAEKMYQKSLPESEREWFAEQPSADRRRMVEKAKEDDKVVYTSADGTEYRKSHDPALVKMARERDEDRKILAKLEAEKQDLEVAKRADEIMKNLPEGEVGAKVELLKAIATIKDEKKREAAYGILKAGDEAMKLTTQRQGGGGQPRVVKAGSGGPQSPEQQLEDLAKRHAEKNNIAIHKAMDEVLRTDEGRKLYDQAYSAPVRVA